MNVTRGIRDLKTSHQLRPRIQANFLNNPLPIIESCEDCGACCMRTPVPPFQPGEEFEKEVPTHLLQLISDRIAADAHFDLVSCVWFNEQQRRCQHYELRPEACRAFEVSSDACRMSRWDVGVDV